MASTINAKNTSTGVVITPDASGQLELQTADTTRMTITSGGNVGIGTSSPSQKLHVAGGNVNWVRVDDTTNSCFTLVGSSSGNGAVGTYSAHPLLLVSNSTERMRINSGGFITTNIEGSGTLYPAYSARTWVNFNGTGTVAIRGSGNVTSITDNGVGLYSINFTTALPDANYSVSVGGSLDNFSASASYGIGIYNLNSTVVSIACRTEANAYADFQIVTASIHR